MSNNSFQFFSKEKHMKLTKTLFAAAAALTLTASAFAIDGRTAVKMALDVKDPDFNHSIVQMDLIEKNGVTAESRQVEEFGRSKNNLSSVVMIFRSPASVKDTRFLQIENGGGKDDDKWIYLPSLRTTRRIASSEGNKAFMGTDATYDDMSTRDVDEDTHEMIDENAAKNGYTCYQVKSTPKDAANSQYQYRVQWIDKKTNVPVYAEMYDKKGTLVKVLTVEKLEAKTGEDGKNTYNTPMSTLLTNVQTGHSTRLIIKQLILDKPLPDRVFTQSFLNTGK
jgi:hypothetical protein